MPNEPCKPESLTNCRLLIRLHISNVNERDKLKKKTAERKYDHKIKSKTAASKPTIE